MSSLKVVIIGAGPTGLGAAHRLDQLGSGNWHLFESSSSAGGLASSFVDDRGFTWDIGAHVQFSHYEYFDAAMHQFLAPDSWLHHQRESWVWMRGRFIPYPLQNNVWRLPPEDLNKCLQGLLEITQTAPEHPTNFAEWITATFGTGIADVFMRPYNYKVWATPPDLMNADWVGERVATTDLGRVLRNLAFKRDDVSWGPNNTFQYPKSGGTGSIWRACAKRLPPERLAFNSRVDRIDLDRYEIMLQNGNIVEYDALVATLPLLEIIRITGQQHLMQAAKRGLAYSSSNIFGLGLRGQPPEELATKCWIYFPEADCPFYRLTVLSNYSPNNVPRNGRFWSLMAEVSESEHKPVQHDRLLERVIQGALETKVIRDRSDVVSTWSYRTKYGYPTPMLHRGEALAEILPFFENRGVYPRGRFGLWKYEVSNQDHSFMQGVEIIERLLHGHAEITAADPIHANSKKHPWPFERWSSEARAIEGV